MTLEGQHGHDNSASIGTGNRSTNKSEFCSDKTPVAEPAHVSGRTVQRSANVWNSFLLPGDKQTFMVPIFFFLNAKGKGTGSQTLLRGRALLQFSPSCPLIDHHLKAGWHE